MSADLVTVAVRGFGYRPIHAATVRPAMLEPASWPSPSYPFTAIYTPVAAICGVSVRSVQPCVVVMQPGTKLTCRTCRALAAERGLEISCPQVHETALAQETRSTKEGESTDARADHS